MTHTSNYAKGAEKKSLPLLPYLEEFDTDIHEQARNSVQPWTKASIVQALCKLLILNGLIVVDHVNSTRNRKEVKQSHGFRKFFETMLVNTNIHEIIIKKLTGHAPSRDLTLLYSKQTEEEMLVEYEKAIDSLTIDPANRLQKKVEMLTIAKDKVDLALSQIEDMKKQIGLS